MAVLNFGVILQPMLLSGPALGMFDVFGRTGPPILGGHLFGLRSALL